MFVHGPAQVIADVLGRVEQHDAVAEAVMNADW